MRYDGFGRQQRWIFPSKTTPGVADQNDYEQYLYDADGNRTSLRKRDGRFLQVDPIGYEDQINLYAYVGNDPVNKREIRKALRT